MRRGCPPPKNYPGTERGSIIPSDYLCKDAVKDDPSNDGNRGNYFTYPRFLERLGRNRYIFAGWDGVDEGSIDVPIVRGATGKPRDRFRFWKKESR